MTYVEQDTQSEDGYEIITKSDEEIERDLDIEAERGQY